MSETGWETAPKAAVLVDFSAVAYACWAPAERAQEKGREALVAHCQACGACGSAGPCAGRPTQYDAHQVLKTNLRQKMDSLVEALPVSSPTEFIMVKDSHPDWKYKLYPQYKGKREDKYNPRPEAEAYLRECYPTMRWVSAPGQEADDAIATLARTFQAEGLPVVIVSGDKDLWQMFDEAGGIRIMNPVTGKWLDLATVAEKFHGLEPRHIRAAKAFWGDSSDNLPNCAPRQQKQLVPLIKAANGDLLKVMEKVVPPLISKVCFDHVSKNLESVVKNWELAGLKVNVDLEWK